MKAQLAETGIPVAPRRIEHVTTPREAAPSLLASGRPLHRLTEWTDPDALAERSWSGVEPEPGAASFVLPHGEARFVNAGIVPWLDTHQHPSPLRQPRHHLGEPDGPEGDLCPVEEEQGVLLDFASGLAGQLTCTETGRADCDRDHPQHPRGCKGSGRGAGVRAPACRRRGWACVQCSAGNPGSRGGIRTAEARVADMAKLAWNGDLPR